MDEPNWYQCLAKGIQEIKEDARESRRLINAQLLKLHIEVAGLKVKSGIWGLIGGLIPVMIMITFFILKN